MYLKLKKLDISVFQVLVLDWTCDAWKFDLFPQIYFWLFKFFGG